MQNSKLGNLPEPPKSRCDQTQPPLTSTCLLLVSADCGGDQPTTCTIPFRPADSHGASSTRAILAVQDIISCSTVKSFSSGKSFVGLPSSTISGSSSVDANLVINFHLRIRREIMVARQKRNADLRGLLTLENSSREHLQFLYFWCL